MSVKTIATINFKGGVGKTTVTWCLGDYLSTYTKSKVLLFDLDAQMSLTQAIALDADGNSSGKFSAWYEGSKKNERTIFNVLCQYLECDLTKFQADNGFVFRLSQDYHFIPSTAQLYWLELEAPDPGKGKFFIKNLLGKVANSAALPKYDYVLFDCPPSFTMLSYSVLTCCDFVFIPFNPDFFAANGVGLLIAGLRHVIQPHPLPKLGVFANRVRTYGGPTRAARQWITEVRDACADVSGQTGVDVAFLDSWVPDRASIRDAITNRRTPDELVPNFKNLWTEATKVLAK
jgi:chromosome partitioning protein